MPEIFQYSFMVRAFIAGGIVGLVCPFLGAFLVLRRLSLIADTLAHVALMGAAIGLLLNWAPLGVAVMVSAVAALVLERLRATRLLADDSALALVLYTALAVAIVLISLGDGLNIDLFGYLFGSIATISTADVWTIGSLGIGVMLLVSFLYTELVQSTFDPVLARVSGVPVGRVNIVLAVLTGVTVTLAMRATGALLVGALVVFPTIAALQMRTGFRTTLLGSALVGLASVFIGLTISFYQDVSPGGVIVLSAVALLIAAVAFRVAARTLRGKSAATPTAPQAPRSDTG
ncbi:MAG: metal ABC transporter permease [Dehalococcoidia bacterium]|nr:metal ABC transporter permease [Dehalococcoidia bacterium]